MLNRFIATNNCSTLDMSLEPAFLFVFHFTSNVNWCWELSAMRPVTSTDRYLNIWHLCFSRHSQTSADADTDAKSADAQMSASAHFRWSVFFESFVYKESRRSSLNVANCCSVSLIAPLVSGVAGLSASSSSKVDTLNIWCKTAGCDSYCRQ